MEVKRHKHGKSVRFTKPYGLTFVHCKDLFAILGLDWHSRRVKNCSTKKFKCPDAQGKNQPQTFILASQMEKFLSRSKRTDKAQWVREAFLGAKPQHKTLSEEKEEKFQRPEPTGNRTQTDLGQQVLDFSLFVKHVYDNYGLSRDTKQWARELVPDIKPPQKRKRLFKLDAVEVEENKHLVWLLRNDGRVFVELGLVLRQLNSPEPLEAYTNDKTFLTVQYEYTNVIGTDPYQDEELLGDFIEIKHIETLEEHSGKPNGKLRAALDTILRSVPREE